MTLWPHPGWSLSPLQWRQALRLLAACALAGGVAGLLHLPEWYWALITAVVVMQPHLSETLSAGWDRVVATLLGATVGLLLIFLQQRGLPTLPLFAVGMLPLAVATAVRPSLRLSCTTLIVVLLIPGGTDPYGRALFRVVDILIGALACVAVSFLVLPDLPEQPSPP